MYSHLTATRSRALSVAATWSCLRWHVSPGLGPYGCLEPGLAARGSCPCELPHPDHLAGPQELKSFDELTAKDVMSSPAVFATPEAGILEVMETLVAKGISGLPICSECNSKSSRALHWAAGAVLRDTSVLAQVTMATY